MRQRTPLTIAAVLALAVLGCQGPAPVAVAPAVEAGVGTIKLDAGSLRAMLGRRWVQTHGGQADPGTAVTKMVLKVYGPGMSPVEASIPWVDDDHAPPVATVQDPLATFSLNVAAGHNRVFVLRGLNSQNQVVHQFHSLGRVQAGGTITVELGPVHDAAGRTLLELLTPNAQGSVPAGLATEDLTTSLIGYVAEATGYDKATNSYAGFSPLKFASRGLADRVRTDGKAILAEPPSESPIQGQARFIVSNYEAGWPYPLEVEVRSTLKRTMTAMGHEVTVSDIPPGDWAVRVKSGSREAWTRVLIDESGTTPDVVATLPTAPELPKANHVIFDGQTQNGWSITTQAGATKEASDGRVYLDFPSADAYVDFRTTQTVDFGLFGPLMLDMSANGSENHADYRIQATDGTHPIGLEATPSVTSEPYGPYMFFLGHQMEPPLVYQLLFITIGEPFGFGLSPSDWPRVRGFRIKLGEGEAGPRSLSLDQASFQAGSTPPMQGDY